ncbi:MAG: FAD-dependent oxidoreductase [Thermoanaerobaculia bacterium]
MRTFDFVVCGAGIAGIAAAHEIAVRRRLGRVLIVDPRPPLSLTSDKSTECYRNWWPDRTMIDFMNRSIDRLEEWSDASGDRFAMNRNGYAYFTADPATAAGLESQARRASALGAGELRLHHGADDDPAFPGAPYDTLDRRLGGADLVTDRARLRATFPFLADDIVAMLRPRRCGWLAAQQLGMWLLEECLAAGVERSEGEVVAIDVEDGAVRGVELRLASGSRERVACGAFVDAAGPMAADVARLAGVDLPLANELHGKVYLDDRARVVPRDLPLMIFCDPVSVGWDDETREALAGDPELAYLTRPLPGGVHFRTEGGLHGTMLLLLFTYHLEPGPALFPPRFDPWYPEVVLRTLARFVPGFSIYLEQEKERRFVDGGYYCKTPENRILVGPTPVAGLYLFCGLSGYGIMAAAAGAELLGTLVAGDTPPGYAAEFALARYDDPAYRARLAAGEFASGQL